MVDDDDNTYGGKYVVNPRYSTYQCDSTIARCNPLPRCLVWLTMQEKCLPLCCFSLMDVAVLIALCHGCLNIVA